ncbi:hypothetical protein L873DRAFT_1714420 [Choiromyces venosus 120613-1]|uniref:DUF7707 domain-containing protein n=1 Tax=Choiromyces venosus 120613-1 TaxID=1336337 RepID=A0A3N4IZE4_9PEZI|nr:hypothetical protein L873DRAFT_1714420 [Choiromyces venosus 120613-1]
MQSFVFAAFVAANSILSVSAQTYPTFNVTAVPDAIRTQWCRAQTAACPLLCGDQDMTTTQNKCFPDNLYYTCICNDGTSPNLTEYSQTIPYFRCQAEVKGCSDACTGNSKCQSACAANRPCGATDPQRLNTSTMTSTRGASKTSSPTGLTTSTDANGFAVTGTAAAGSKGAGSPMMEVGNAYGLGFVAAGIAIGAALMGV